MPQQDAGQTNKRKATKVTDDGLSLTLTKAESWVDVEVAPGDTINLKMIGCTGTLPRPTADEPGVPDRLVNLTSALALKRRSDTADAFNAKRLKTAAALLVASTTSPTKSESGADTSSGSGSLPMEDVPTEAQATKAEPGEPLTQPVFH